MNHNVKELYEPLVRGARGRLHTDPGVKALFDSAIDPMFLLRFLITYNASGVYMTEPVEGWIRRAGERCVEVGLKDLGRSLIKHARHEAGHHLMMIEDTRQLVARWNARRSSTLDPERLFAAPPLSATQRYIALHEDTIASDTPFGQVAIEFEIEGISVSLFTRLVEHWKAVLGPGIMSGLSFLKEHVEIDVGHTELNERMMERLLKARPDAVEELGRVGSAALDTYRAFINDCLAATHSALSCDVTEAA